MANDTIQARMETIEALHAEVYRKKFLAEEDEEDRSPYPVTALFHGTSRSWDHGNDGGPEDTIMFQHALITDRSTGAWKAVVADDSGNDHRMFLASRGDTPEEALDRLLEQLKQMAQGLIQPFVRPLLGAIDNAENAKIPV